MADLPAKIQESTRGGAAARFETATTATPRHLATEHTVDWLFLHCLGFGACWGWVHIAFFSTVLWGAGGEVLSLEAWLVNAFANGCAMVGLGFLSLRLAPLSARNGLVAALALLTAAGTIGLSFGQALGTPFVYVGSIASGIGTAGILLLWAEAYRSISPTIAKKYTIPWSMAVGVLYYLVIGMLPILLAVAVTTALPLASVVLLRQSNRLRAARTQRESDAEATADNPRSSLRAARATASAAASGNPNGTVNPPNTTGQSDHRHSWRGTLPLRFAACAAVYCIPAGFMRGYPAALPFASAGGIGEAVFAGVAVIMIAVAVASILLMGSQKIDLAYKLVVPLMAAGLLLLPFLAPGQEAVAGICIMSGYILFEMYVWASLADIAANLPAPSALVFGIGKSGMNLGLLMGTFIGIWLGSSSSMLLVAISLLIVYLFIVVENVIGPKGGVALPLQVPSSSPADEAIPPREKKVTIAEAAQMDLAEVFSTMLHQRCSALSERCGLSARETEVLELLAKGRSLQSIADTLGVAYSTVKTHTDRIYAKTDVHSRQELIELLEHTDNHA